jgi:hypothetical protein
MNNEKIKPGDVQQVTCINPHADCLTKGKVYNAVGESDKYYDIYPDDFGHLSGFDKRFFESTTNPQT